MSGLVSGFDSCLPVATLVGRREVVQVVKEWISLYPKCGILAMKMLYKLLKMLLKNHFFVARKEK